MRKREKREKRRRKNHRENRKNRKKTKRGKKRVCRNDKHWDHLRMYTLALENTGEPPSSVWFSWGQSAFSGCAYSLGESGEPPL